MYERCVGQMYTRLSFCINIIPLCVGSQEAKSHRGLDLNKKLGMIGFSLRPTLSLLYPQAGFSCRFAVGREGKISTPLGNRASGFGLPALNVV